MSRVKWKSPAFDLKLFKNVYCKDYNIKVWSRNSIISESLIGKRVLIHNGNVFKKLLIIREKVGFKFGDFSYTRKNNHKFVTKKYNKKK